MNDSPGSDNQNPKRQTGKHVNAPKMRREHSLPLLPTPDELVAMLSRRVIGHEQAKRDLAVAAYNHLVTCAHSDLRGGRVQPEPLMLIGPTGSGKSHLFRNLGEHLGLPMFMIDCSNIAPYGYKGRDVVQHLDELSSKVVHDDYTNPSIVVLEEVDKLRDDGSQHGSYRRTIQQDFLTYLEGNHCGSGGKLDSSRILTIACGAFVGLDAIRFPHRKAMIGFNTLHHGTHPDPKPPPVRPEDLVAYGLIPEFVGRFPRLSSLDSLDATAMRRILTEAESNVLLRKKEFFQLHGVRLEFTEDALDAVVAMAMVHPTGARALRLIIDRVLRSVEHRLPEMAQRGITALVYDRAAVRGDVPPAERNSGIPVFLDLLFEVRRRASSYAAWIKPRSVFDDD